RFVMPCHGDTIVKIKVRQTCNNDSKLIAIRAFGVFPVESDDCQLDLSLFIPMNEKRKRSSSQSIFELNKYYCVSGKVVLGNYNGNFIWYPLKVSLVGVAQDAPKEINRQIEIIDKDLYIYAVDISYVDISSATKKKVPVFENSPALYRSVRSRLLTVHQSINEDSFNSSEIKNYDLGKEKIECEVGLTTEDSHVTKRTRLEDVNDDYV
ncbi:3327_t:CDS:2, partial [Racocetra persica]